MDDSNIQRTDGGKIYSFYGVKADGLLAIVRPDGYVGTIAPFDDLPCIDNYFRGIFSLS